jgi:dipeptidyl aminopeptidase/acylaminoacyl peptidase
MFLVNPPKRKNDQQAEIRPHHLTILSVVFLISVSTIGSLWWNASRPKVEFPAARLMFWQNYQGVTLDLQSGEMALIQDGPTQDNLDPFNPWLKESPDGKWFARWSRDNECCQWSLHIYEGIDGPNEGFITRFGGGDMVSWTPDSEWIAFSAYPEGTLHDPNDLSQLELYLANIDTHEIKRLTDNNVMDSGPSISPDGTKMAYTSSVDGRNHLYIMDMVTGESRLLTAEIQGYNPAWSPDGTWLAFVTKCGSHDPMHPTHGALWVIRSDGTDATKIQQRVNFIEPKWLS